MRHRAFDLHLLTVDGVSVDDSPAFTVRQNDEVISTGVATLGVAQFTVLPRSSDDIYVSWGPADGQSRFSRRVSLRCVGRGDSRRTIEERLWSLGYFFEAEDDGSYVRALERFQVDYDLGDEAISPERVPDAVVEQLSKIFNENLEHIRPAKDDESEPDSEPAPELTENCCDVDFTESDDEEATE